MRVLVTGASGSGTTTLGRALSVRLGSSFLDADDYYWIPTDPPYEEKRDPAARLQLILADLRKASSAVVAGCVRNWGGELEDSFSLIVFLILDAEIRVARLREREMSELGRVDEVFLEWAAQYDTGRDEIFSRQSILSKTKGLLRKNHHCRKCDAALMGLKAHRRRFALNITYKQMPPFKVGDRDAGDTLPGVRSE